MVFDGKDNGKRCQIISVVANFLTDFCDIMRRGWN